MTRVVLGPEELPAEALEFLRERHLATVTTVRPDGSPHVAPVGFTWDAEALVARVITGRGTRKVANVRAGSRVVLCQVDGRRWLALEGPADVREEAHEVREAEQRYAGRYRVPRPNPERVTIVVSVDRVIGNL